MLLLFLRFFNIKDLQTQLEKPTYLSHRFVFQYNYFYRKCYIFCLYGNCDLNNDYVHVKLIEFSLQVKFAP